MFMVPVRLLSHLLDSHMGITSSVTEMPMLIVSAKNLVNTVTNYVIRVTSYLHHGVSNKITGNRSLCSIACPKLTNPKENKSREINICRLILLITDQ